MLYKLNRVHIDKIKKIEKLAYPYHMRGMQNARNMRDILDYCGCNKKEFRAIIRDNWYFICVERRDSVYIVDFASTGKCKDIFLVLESLNKFKKKIIKMDAREDTSYPIIKSMEKFKKLRILKDYPWDWGGVTMHEIECMLL